MMGDPCAGCGIDYESPETCRSCDHDWHQDKPRNEHKHLKSKGGMRVHAVKRDKDNWKQTLCGAYFFQNIRRVRKYLAYTTDPVTCKTCLKILDKGER